MSLKSNLFKGDPKLEACAVNDAAHIIQGAVGEHVGKIQTALIRLGFCINSGEVATNRYGPSTAAVVKSYKDNRHIINYSYQTQADNIVGKMTIAALDKEMLEKENQSPPPLDLSHWSVTTATKTVRTT